MITFVRLILYDEFGDGWNGLVLYINHSFSTPKNPPKNPPALPPKIHSPTSTPVSKDSSPDPSRAFRFEPSLETSSQSYLICASLDDDRSYQKGTYKIQFGTPVYDTLLDAPYHWEAGFQISTKNENFRNVIFGGISTQIEIEFTPEGLFRYKSIRSPLQQPSSCDKCPHSIKPIPGEVPKGHTLTLYDKNRGFWHSHQLFPTRYVISDASKTKIVQSGMMCNHGESEICDIILEDGDYYLRIGNEWDESEISWNFCGTNGQSQEEISFSIIGGHCHLGHQVTIQTILESIEETYLTIEGQILLENIFSSDLSIFDQRVFEVSIADILNLDSKAINIIHICETQPGILCDMKSPKKKPQDSVSELLPRLLSQTFAYDVTFFIKLKLEDVGGNEYIGTQYAHIRKYFAVMKEKFDSSIRLGALQTTIRSRSESIKGRSSLQYIRLGSFSSLRLTDVNYEYVSRTLTPTMSPVSDHDPLVEVVIINETQEQELLLLIPLIFVLGAILIVGVIALMSRKSIPSEVDQKLQQHQPIIVEEGDILVQTGLSSIPDDMNIERYIQNPTTWETERSSIYSDEFSIP